MDCLVMPGSILRRRSSSCSRLGYEPLTSEDHMFSDGDYPVKVVVGKEKREFFVDAYVLEENPFRVLIEMVAKGVHHKGKSYTRDKRVIFVDVDSILFEHMLWLMHNDCSSLLQLNLKEIIDFYAQDN